MLKKTYKLYLKSGLCGVVMILSLNPVYLFAQSGVYHRSSDQQSSLPSFKPVMREPGGILPRLPLPRDEDTESLSAGQHVMINKFIIVGNSVLPDVELHRLTKEYVGIPMSHQTLMALRDRVTRLYIQKGYINSGAVIPPQKIIDGTLVIKIIEGKLTGLDYETDGGLNEAYIRDYIDISPTKVLNIHTLEEQLQHLNRSRLIQQVQGKIIPGVNLGESILRLKVIETAKVHGHAHINNYNSPAVGAEGVSLLVRVNNLSGRGDSLQTDLARSKGMLAYGVNYEWPLHARYTSVVFDLYRSDSDIIERDFADLNFESSSASYGLGLRQNVYLKRNSRVDFLVKVESRKSQLLFLDGLPFEGENSVSALRFSKAWVHQEIQDAITLRSVISVGRGQIEGVSSTEDLRVGSFLTWLGQFHWAHRFEDSLHRFNLRADAQLSDGPLLNMEQFSIGGHASVRGYRENTFVRDNGWLLSTEYIIPFVSNKLSVSWFIDAGRSWNKHDNHADEKLLSIGAGLDWKPAKNTVMRIDFARAHKRIPSNAKYNLQDEGVHFSVGMDF